MFLIPTLSWERQKISQWLEMEQNQDHGSWKRELSDKVGAQFINTGPMDLLFSRHVLSTMENVKA